MANKRNTQGVEREIKEERGIHEKEENVERETEVLKERGV